MDDHDRHKLTPGIDLLDDALSQAEASELRIVLGHHPLDWLEDSQAQSMRIILGKHNAIYLHGHLHENDTRYDDGGQGAFLTVRCGSAFQGRPDDKVKWVNGLLWGEIDFDERQVILKPFQWSPKFHAVEIEFRRRSQTSIFEAPAGRSRCLVLNPSAILSRQSRPPPPRRPRPRAVRAAPRPAGPLLISNSCKSAYRGRRMNGYYIFLTGLHPTGRSPYRPSRRSVPS